MKSSANRVRKWRGAHEAEYVFYNLRNNAKCRGILFNLSTHYWKWFCGTTGYLRLRGRKRNDMTVDRIVDELGYVDGNIQMLVNWKNKQKEQERLRIMKYVKQPGDVF